MKDKSEPLLLDHDKDPDEDDDGDKFWEWKHFWTLAPAFLCVFVDYFGYGIAIPILPFFALDLGASSLEIGIMTGIYPLFQLFGNIVMGQVSDKYGRKPVVIASMVASSVSYIFVAVSNTVPQLILSRAFAGFCGSTMPVAQAMVLDVVTEAKDRPKYIGICSSMLGLAFTVGPAISAGITAATSFRVTFFIAAGFSLCITVWAIVNVKETKKSILEGKLRTGTEEPGKIVVESEGPPPPPLGLLVYGPALSLYLCAWCFFVQSSVAPLAWEDLFGWGSSELGAIQSVAGVIQVVADAFIARRAMAKVGAFNLCSAMALLCGVGTILAFLVHIIVPHLLLVALIFVGWGMIKTPMITIVGQYAAPENRGAAVGTLLGSMSLGFATGPIVSGLLYDLQPVPSGEGFSYLPFIVGIIVATLSALNMIFVERATRSEREEKDAAKLRVSEAQVGRGEESGKIPRMGSSFAAGASMVFDDTTGTSGKIPRQTSVMERLSHSAYGSAI